MRTLMSYHYYPKPESFKTLAAAGLDILLDSGAYSAYNSGDPVDIDEYCRFCQEVEPFVDGYFQLDELYDVEKTRERLAYMRGKYGLDPIPVWQAKGPRWDDIDEWASKTDWVAIGGMVNQSNHRRSEGFKYKRAAGFMERIPEDTRVHMLGETSEDVLGVMKPYSADSSAAMMEYSFASDVKFWSPHYQKWIEYSFDTKADIPIEAMDAARRLIGYPELPFERLRDRSSKKNKVGFSWGRMFAFIVNAQRHRMADHPTNIYQVIASAGQFRAMKWIGENSDH